MFETFSQIWHEHNQWKFGEDTNFKSKNSSIKTENIKKNLIKSKGPP